MNNETTQHSVILTPESAVRIAGAIVDIVTHTKEDAIKGFKIKHSSSDTISLEVIYENK